MISSILESIFEYIFPKKDRLDWEERHYNGYQYSLYKNLEG